MHDGKIWCGIGRGNIFLGQAVACRQIVLTVGLAAMVPKVVENVKFALVNFRRQSHYRSHLPLRHLSCNKSLAVDHQLAVACEICPDKLKLS